MPSSRGGDATDADADAAADAAAALEQARGPRPWSSRPVWGALRQGRGCQQWADGSAYEGEYVNGLKHGAGRLTWRNGECYVGSFHRDYRHGDGAYCWPSGHRVCTMLTRSLARVSSLTLMVDVGLWYRDHLARLCTTLEGGFSLSSLPEYAAYMVPSAATGIDPLMPTVQRESDPLWNPYPDMLSEESFTRPAGLEFYSTDGDHLPLPPGFRQELDRCFFRELWEPELDRDPAATATLPWAAPHAGSHTQTQIFTDTFGPKGPLELSSEMLIHKACVGDLQAVNRILRTRCVSPDVSDARGHTPLIAATVNCHNAVINLLLDMGVDIDKLNCEGMNALAVCHVLYYPFQSLHTTVAERAVPPTPVVTPQPRQAYSPYSSSRGDMENNLQETRESSAGDDNEQGSVKLAEGGEEVQGEVCSLEVLDGHIPLGSVTWRGVFDSARSLDSFVIPVTEDGMQFTAEALSRIRVSQRADSQETVRKMAAMKTEHRARWSTLRLLLQRGADPNASRVPMPVLFLAIKAAHTEGVVTLLQCGARTDTRLPSETRTEPQTVLGNKTPAPTSWGSNSEHNSASKEAPAGGGRTALHVACQRDNDYSNARKVVALLLSHRSSTHLLWSAHSPLSLAIASGNDMLQMLVKAGADISMPVVVGEGQQSALGTAVDYAHYTFNQDPRIARTVYCKLSQLEKETYKAREAADSKAAELANSREHRARRPLRSCYQCGRSAFVTLTPCSRCHRVLYCSNRCKLQAWEHRHRDECIRVPASTSSSQQNKRLKSSRMPRPLVVAEKVAEGHISCSENYSFI
ncbi:LOW QUALITY PROTEIN: hypothetical protein CRUP_025415 [Coryphaenoides rupestris]|nr:LOW QUALITY PROTEIN: hypothetical protein CRUP_025415 [Coryphaenoides rupestris]